MKLIRDMIRENEIPTVTMEELETIVKFIDKGKSNDSYGLAIEHILNAGISAFGRDM